MRRHATPATWRGTPKDNAELLAAVGRYCLCEVDISGIRTVTCGPHRMLLSDQRALDGLLFARYIRNRLTNEEFGEAGVAQR